MVGKGKRASCFYCLMSSVVIGAGRLLSEPREDSLCVARRSVRQCSVALEKVATWRCGFGRNGHVVQERSKLSRREATIGEGSSLREACRRTGYGEGALLHPATGLQ